MDTSRVIAVKDCWRGQEYSDDEIQFLQERWENGEAEEVADWLGNGGRYSERPSFLIVLLDSPDLPEYDLRGIDLGHRLRSPRPNNAPRICLSGSRLEHAKLHYCNLQYSDLRLCHLSHVHLAAAGLEHADMRYAHLEEANLDSSRLQDAKMNRAHLEGASLEDANLDNAVLAEARLQHASLARASIRRANFTEAQLEDTNFRKVTWEADATCYVGFDVRGIRYSDPLFDQFVRQSEFIRRIKETSPKWYWVWSLLCDCGRGFLRLLGVCGALILAFALVFYLSALAGHSVVKPDPPMSASNPITYLYFSVVTFSTLGFGDVTPCNSIGQIVLMLEVLLGYVALGALISVFSMKILPPR